MEGSTLKCPCLIQEFRVPIPTWLHLSCSINFRRLVRVMLILVLAGGMVWKLTLGVADDAGFCSRLQKAVKACIPGAVTRSGKPVVA